MHQPWGALGQGSPPAAAGWAGGATVLDGSHSPVTGRFANLQAPGKARPRQAGSTPGSKKRTALVQQTTPRATVHPPPAAGPYPSLCDRHSLVQQAHTALVQQVCTSCSTSPHPSLCDRHPMQQAHTALVQQVCVPSCATGPQPSSCDTPPCSGQETGQGVGVGRESGSPQACAPCPKAWEAEGQGWGN